jgi:diadenosine tetraphosphate (Ap4A) HIT family hydrolase
MSDCELCAQQGDVVARSADWRVVLVDDQHYPGFCRVIWNHHVQEMTDLTLAQRNMLMKLVWQVESAVREVMRPHKINLASLGNVVPHLHWHVIPRYRDDLHFPNPIWGKVERSINAALTERRALVPELRVLLVTRLQVES